MLSLMFLLYLTAALGLITAGLHVAVRRRLSLIDYLTSGARAAAIVAASLILITMIGWNTLAAAPILGPDWLPAPSMAVHPYQFALPLVAGLVATAILMFPVTRPEGRPVADLSRRTVADFSRRWWLISSGVVVATVITATLIAGAASSPDENGNSTMYIVEHGSFSMGTSIYGWHYSWIGLALTALIVATTAITLVRIARPPLAIDREFDVAVRRSRTRNVFAIANATLLLHLSSIITSLWNASSILGVGSTDIGPLRFEPNFAALEGTLEVARLGVAVLAYWLLFRVLIGAITAQGHSTRMTD